MARTIRMPDGTLIKNVPDGVSKEDFSAKLIRHYGQERYDQMVGTSEADTAGVDPVEGVEPVKDKGEQLAQPTAEIPERPDFTGDETFSSIPATSKASQYLKDISNRTGRAPTQEEQNEAVRMRREDEGIPEFPDEISKFNYPYQQGEGSTSEAGQQMLDENAPDGKPLPLNTEGLPRRVDHEKGTWKSQAEWKRGEAGRQAELKEQYPDRLTPLEVHEEVLQAGRDAKSMRERTRLSPRLGMLDTKARRMTDDRAMGKKFTEIANLRQHTAEELGVTQDQLELVLTPLPDEPETEEEVAKREHLPAYYTLLYESPDVAAKMYPEIHAEEQAKLEAKAPRLLDKDHPSLADRKDNGWMKYWGSVVWDGSKNVMEGYKASYFAEEKQKDTRKIYGQLALRHIAAEHAELEPEATEILQGVADQYGISVQDLAIQSVTSMLNNAEEEAGSLKRAIKNIEKMESLKPAGADTTTVGHYTNLIMQNSTQMVYIAAAMALRNPGLMVVAMGTEIYGKEYTSRRLSGRTHDQAHQDAVVATIIEGVTESVPVAKGVKLLKQGHRGKLVRLGEMGVTEFSQEVLAELGMIGYDIGIVGEEVTWGEAINRITDAGVVGMAVGTAMTAPAIGMMDTDMANADDRINKAKKALNGIARRMQGPASRSDLKEIGAAKNEFVAAVIAKKELVLANAQKDADKKKAKQDKREDKRKARRSPAQVRRENAAEKAKDEDQTVEGEVTDELLEELAVLEKASTAKLGRDDAKLFEALANRGLVGIKGQGTPILLPAGKRRMEAIIAARDGEVVEEVDLDEALQDIDFEAESEKAPYAAAREKVERAAIDDEIGRRMRGEDVTPDVYVREETRRKTIEERIDEKINDPEARARIVDGIIRHEQTEKAYNEREAALEREAIENRDQDYETALNEQADVAVEQANILSTLDEKGVSGYAGTRLGDVLRNAMNVLEEEEVVALEDLEEAWNEMSTQGTLFDIGGAIAKGTPFYANLVKVGALKLAKHGLKYSAWTADMIGQFGESIKPVLSRVYHDAKKRVQDVMKLSHEKFQSGVRKGELKYAPKQYVKPGQIRQLRAVMKKLAMEGVEGRFWYEKSGKEILKITGGNLVEARQLAGLFAIYSSGTAVSANTTNALKLWAQFKGKDGKLRVPKEGTIAGRFGKMDRLAIEWLRSSAADEHFVEKFGNKRFPFYLNIMREVDPKNYQVGQGVTVDLWMMRAFGYDTAAPTDAQYAFVATEIKRLADQLGWEKQQVQAAIWVAIKSRWEYVQKIAKAKAVEQGLATKKMQGKDEIFEAVGETREDQIVNEKKIVMLFRGEAMKVSIKNLQAKLKASKADFADNLEKHYAVMSWEAEPSSKLGSALKNMSLADKVLMQAEIAEIFVNPKTGREFLAEWLNLLGNDQIVGPGAWEMNVGAVVQNSLLVPVRHKPERVGKEAQAQAKAAMDGYAAIMGYLLKQDAVAWHKPFYGTTLKTSNGVEIQVKGVLSAAKTLELYKAIYAATDNMNFAPIVLDGAVRVLNFSEFDTDQVTVSNRDFHKIIAAAATKAKIKGNIEVFQSDGDMIMNDWRTKKRGQDYVDTINNSKDPAVAKAFARAKRKFAGPVAQVYAKFSSERTDAKIRGSHLTQGQRLKRRPKGTMRFRIFRQAEYAVLDVDRSGEGLKGAERKRGSMKIISAYPNVGFKKEVGLGNNEYVIDVPKDQLYDASEDSLGLMEVSQSYSGFKQNDDGTKTRINPRLDWNKYEEAIKEAGFKGYYLPQAKGNLKGQARFFESIAVDNHAVAEPAIEQDAPQFSISSRPRVTVVENEYEEYEVREKNGEVYFASEVDDAINTARSIHGLDATVVVIDEHGDVITTDVAKTKPERITLDKTNTEDVEAVSEFLDEWFEHTTENPLSGAERIVDGKAAVEIRPQAGQIWVDSVRSFEKGTKGGSAAMKLVLELADLHGVTLRLTAKPFETGGNELNYGDLVAWYQRNGFVTTQEEGGYEPSSSMIREAKYTTPQFSVFRGKKKSGKEWDRSEWYEPGDWKLPRWWTNGPPVRNGERATREEQETFYNSPFVRDVLGHKGGITTPPGFVSESKTLEYTHDDKGGRQVRDKETGDELGYIRPKASEEVLAASPGIQSWSKPEDETQGDIKVTIGLITETNAGYGVPVGVVMAWIDNHLKPFYGTTNFEVVAGVEELPAELYGQIMHFGYGGVVRGAYHEDPIHGPTIWIVANNAYIDDFESTRYGQPDWEGLQETVLHELVGHFGLQAMLGNNYNTVMDMIIRDFPEYKDHLRKRKDGKAHTLHQRRTAAEEVAAYTAGEVLNKNDLTKNQQRLWDKIVNIIKMKLAELGLRKLTHEDIAQLVMRASSYVKNTSEATLIKRARKVKRIRHAQRVMESAQEVEIVDGLPQLSIGMKKARAEDPELESFFRKIGHGKNSRMDSLTVFWHNIVDNWRRRMEIELLDQFAGIRHMEQDLEILGSESGYMSVRLTAGTDVMIRAAIEQGAPMWNPDGTVMIIPGSDSLFDVLAGIAKNKEVLKAFEAYIVAHRAKRLKKEDRENLFSRKEIAAALQFIRKKKLYGLFRQTAKDLARYKAHVLDFAQEAGVIDPVARKLWENADHVPFYRMLSDKHSGTGFTSSRFGKIGTVVHRLRGGEDILHDPLGSIVQNLSMLMEAAIKNRATADVIKNFDGTGVVSKAPQAEITSALIPLDQIKEMLYEAGVALDAVGDEMLTGIQKLTALQPPSGKDIIHVMEGGKRQYYYIHDAGVLRGLDNVTATQWIWLMQILRAPKRLLTRMITLMPDFVLKNWFRDVWHSYILARHGTLMPLYHSFKGWAKAIREDKTVVDMQSGGGLFDAGYVNASDPQKTKIAIRKGLLGEGRHGIIDTPRKWRKLYMRLANGAENAARVSIYQKTLHKAGSRKQALFEARDIMDFSVRGANPIVRFLCETVPFLGARIQGIARTGKGFTENPMRTSMRALPIVLATMALSMKNDDDERYKGLNPYEKRMYYHIYDLFGPGSHIRLPKPFEVGAIFSTIPEILYELAMSEEPDRGKAAAWGVWWAVSEMMSLRPDVQALAPAYELMINENTFTTAPIVSDWDKALDPKDRFNERTSPTIRELVQHMPDSAPEFMRSPKEMEHLIRGYLGSAADYALAASDMIFQKQLNEGIEGPSWRKDQIPGLKSFIRDENGSYNVYLQSMYEVLEAGDKIHNSITKNEKLPQTPKVKARIETLKEENEELLRAREPAKKAANSIKKINIDIRHVYADARMTPDQKREKIDKLLAIRAETAKKIYDYRPGGKKGSDPVTSYWDLIKGLAGKPKDEQVDSLIEAELPHTATLINDITISDEKLEGAVE